MYHVTVWRNHKAIDDMACPFGEWSTIGAWLDDYGYNDPGYKAIITFS